MISVLIAAAAFAQSITVDAGNALEGVPGTFTERGVGAPAVAWDPVQSRYIMVFESQTGDPDANCPGGYWSLGAASSEDGYAWEIYADPIVEPTAGTPWSCYAAHPALLRDDDGTFRVWFKAGQGQDACATSTPAWGCELEPGIGMVSGDIQLDDKTDEIAFYESELVRIDGEIDQTVTDLGAAADDFLAALTASTALECVNYVDICSPCYDLTLSATHGGGNSPTVITRVDLCQPFDFTPPGELPVAEGSAGKRGTFAYLNYGQTAASATCTYKGNSDLEFAPYIQEIAQGQCNPEPLTDRIELQIDRSSRDFPQTTVEITLSTSSPQSWQGPGYDELGLLSDLAASLDVAGVEAQGPIVLTVLSNLRDELYWQNQTAEVLALDAEAAALEDAITQALADIDALQAERASVEATLDGLYAYVPSVSVSGNGLSLVKRRASYPTVAKVGGTYYMQVQFKRNILAASSADGNSFAFTGSGAVLYNQATWAASEVLTPALTCNDDAVASDRFETLLVGRETLLNIPGNTVVQGGVGDATSTDFVSWLFNTVAWNSFADNTSWRHIEALRDGGQRRVWLSEIDGSGKSVIRTGSTGAVDTNGGGGRICP